MKIADFSLAEGLGEGQYRARTWIPDGELIVLGRSRKEELEIDIARAREDRVPVIRRVSGGGTVVLDRDCIVVEVGHRPRTRLIASDFMAACNGAIIRALRELGIMAEQDEGWPDIRVGAKKLAGCAVGIRKNQYLYGASVIGSRSTKALAERYLRLPERRPSYRCDRSHSDFMTSLEELGFAAGVGLATRIQEIIRHELHAI
ncbi:MAG: hypothetical protein Q8M76_14080 [Spirochaetaceae bacterium]|nr:hypothetical protein [Spirochaetaceae bacterium]